MSVITRMFSLPEGGKVKVTVTYEGHIDPNDFPILLEKYAVNMARDLIRTGEALKKQKEKVQ